MKMRMRNENKMRKKLGESGCDKQIGEGDCNNLIVQHIEALKELKGWRS